VTRVSAERRRDLEAADDLDERLVTSLVGFTRVVRHLRQRRLPLVGHNCLLDLMLMHNLFNGPLPKEYIQFKASIHSWFPEVYDTKHITHSVRDICSSGEVARLLSASCLLSLHQALTSHVVRTTVLHPPVLALAETATRYEAEVAHEAGYDAYMAASCCLRLAHLIAHKDATSSESHRPLSAREHLAALSGAKNHVNVIRGNVNFLCLDGPDPQTERPRWFHLATRGTATLNIVEVMEMLSRCGTVDIRPYSARQALVAVGNYGCARDVLRVFRSDKRFTITQYSVLRHSPLVRALLWSGVAVSVGVTTVLLLSQLRRPPA